MGEGKEAAAVEQLCRHAVNMAWLDCCHAVTWVEDAVHSAVLPVCEARYMQAKQEEAAAAAADTLP